MTNKNWQYLIVGLGQTGLSCVRYLSKKNALFAVVDSRESPPGMEYMKAHFPQVEVFAGGLNKPVLMQAECLIVSPGIPLYEPAIADALACGCHLSSDIELFLAEVTKPVLAVTGSNGKSTVVSLLGEMARQQSLNVPVVGNVGVAVLDVLAEQGKQDTAHDAYIMELSSFQLERLQEATFACASILNVSEDHLDRYKDWQAYVDAKQVIYQFAHICVVNRDDENTLVCDDALTANQLSFGLSLQTEHQQMFGLANINGEDFLMQGDIPIMAQSEVQIPGRHNMANALAALAMSDAMGWDRQAAVAALKVFSGLEHRCQYVNTIDDVDFINDSKGTNVGACVAAIEGLCGGTDKRVVLIAGGEGKGADFSPLVPAMQKYGRAAVLIGTDAPVFYELLSDVLPCNKVDSMKQAVSVARKFAEPGDYVLLSPACASFDMFDNYMHRGDVFSELVNAADFAQEVTHV